VVIVIADEAEMIGAVLAVAEQDHRARAVEDLPRETADFVVLPVAAAKAAPRATVRAATGVIAGDFAEARIRTGDLALRRRPWSKGLQWPSSPIRKRWRPWLT
jgi:hypothetical protein